MPPSRARSVLRPFYEILSRLFSLTFVSLFLVTISRAALPLKGGAIAAFPLASEHAAAPFLIESGTDRAVARASDDVRGDIERIPARCPP